MVSSLGSLRAEQAGRGLEVPLPTPGWFFRSRSLQSSEVVEVGLADPTTNQAKMKGQVIFEIRIGDPKQVGAELAATRAADAVSSPDFADGVSPLIATPGEQGGPLEEIRPTAEKPFNFRSPFGREHLVEIGAQFRVSGVHAADSVQK